MEIPEDLSAPQTADELAAKDGPVHKITVRGQQLHFTNSGHLWVFGTCDDVLQRGLCVALIYGSFKVNEQCEAEKKKRIAKQ